MALYTTLHLHNAPQGREGEVAKWFDGPRRGRLWPVGIAYGGDLSVYSS